MDTMPLEAGLTGHEHARFAAVCRRQGYRTEQFRISSDFLYRPDAAPPTMVRELSIAHIHYGCMRRYYAWHCSDWLTAFEDDLRKGIFHGADDYEWA